MLIAGRQMAKILALNSKMETVFDIKGMGRVGYILRICIEHDRSKKRLLLSQEEYIDKVLQHFNMIGGKALMTQLPSHVKLSKLDYLQFDEKKGEMEKLFYVSACGSLMYEMIATCTHISFVLGVVSIYMSNPSKKH